jgi:hypothetical protein
LDCAAVLESGPVSEFSIAVFLILSIIIFHLVHQTIIKKHPHSSHEHILLSPTVHSADVGYFLGRVSILYLFQHFTPRPQLSWPFNADRSRR